MHYIAYFVAVKLNEHYFAYRFRMADSSLWRMRLLTSLRLCDRLIRRMSDAQQFWNQNFPQHIVDLAQPRHAAWSACWFWGKYKKINRFADIQHFEHCGALVNGKTPPLGWPDRERCRKLAKWLIIKKFEAILKFQA